MRCVFVQPWGMPVRARTPWAESMSADILLVLTMMSCVCNDQSQFNGAAHQGLAAPSKLSLARRPPGHDLILGTVRHTTQDTSSVASGCTSTPGASCGCSKNVATQVYSVRGLKSADAAKAFRAHLIDEFSDVTCHPAQLPLLSFEVDTSRNVVKVQWHVNDAPASIEVCPRFSVGACPSLEATQQVKLTLILLARLQIRIYCHL